MYDGRSGKNIESITDASFRLARVVNGYQPVHCLPDGQIAWRRNFYFPASMLPHDRFYAFGRSVGDYDGACLMFERGD